MMCREDSRKISGLGTRGWSEGAKGRAANTGPKVYSTETSALIDLGLMENPYETPTKMSKQEIQHLHLRKNFKS